MAIIQCKECGNSISDRAERCIYCGCPISENKAPVQVQSVPVMQEDKPTTVHTKKHKATYQKRNNHLILTVCILAVIIIVLAIISISLLGKIAGKEKDDEYRTEKTAGIANTFKNEDLPAAVEYRFIDYTDFSQYWFDGVFRCGTDFSAGDYYILPLFGAGAMYDVSSSPNDWSWSNYRCLRKISAKEGDYVNVEHGAIMVSATEVDTNNWRKYGVYLVGRDILAGEYKMETITDTYCTDLYNIEGISGAYQICDNNIENNPVDSNYLFESQKYITLENGQYIAITNISLTNVDAPTQNQGNSKETRLSNCEKNGHQADDWQITKEATYTEHGEKIRLCTECNEVIESQSFELTSCVDNNRFVFTPLEFTSKLSEELEEIEGNYGAFIGVRDEDNVLASCIFRNTESSGVCHIIYMDGDESFTGDSAKTYTGADCVGIIFDRSCDAQELSHVLPAILCSLNPSYSFDNAVELSNSIIEESEESAVIEDGIVYRLVDVSGIMDSNWWLYIMIED